MTYRLFSLMCGTSYARPFLPVQLSESPHASPQPWLSSGVSLFFTCICALPAIDDGTGIFAEVQGRDPIVEVFKESATEQVEEDMNDECKKHLRECIRAGGMAAKCFQEMTECRKGPGLRREDDGQNEGSLQEMGCDNASFMKSRAAVMEAISLFTKVDVAEIKCVGNSVQVGSEQPP